MLIEISLIQKFTLFLGQPVYSLSALFFAVLVGAGIGSYVSGRIRGISSIVKLCGAGMIVAVLVILYIWILPSIFEPLLGATIGMRIMSSVALILPVGVVLGVPFPTGISLIHTLQMTEQVPRMWAVNGFSSVLGSVTAISLAITWGFQGSLYLGTLFYLLVSIIFLLRKNLFQNLKTS